MYGGRKIYSKTRDYKKDISQLQSLNLLTLPDLNKIRRFVAEYPMRVERIRNENIQIQEKNKDIDQNNQYAHRAVMMAHSLKEKEKDILRDPINKRILQLHSYIMSYKTWLGGFEANIGGETYRISSHAKPAFEEYVALKKKWSDLNLHVESIPPYPHTPHIAKKKLPRDYTVLRIGGANVRVFYKKFSIDQIDEEIAKRLTEIGKERDKIQEIQARAAANEAETRAQAKKFRNEFENQTKILNCCPYCEGSIKLNDAHLDHIYPV